MSEMYKEILTRKDDVMDIKETKEENTERISLEERELLQSRRMRMEYYEEMRAFEEEDRLKIAKGKPEKMGAFSMYTRNKRNVLFGGKKKMVGIALSEESKALEKKSRMMRAGGVAGAAAMGAVVAGPVGAAIGGFALGTYWAITDLLSSHSRKNTQN